MVEEIRPPSEGLSTLSAQFTRAAADKVAKGVRQLVQSGKSEDHILKTMREQLQGFDARSVKRLFDMAVGRPIADDIAQADVESEREVRAGAIEVTIRKPDPNVSIPGLIRYRGKDWYATGMTGGVIAMRSLD